ncbi:fumarylacetoacetate hydrolase family protein [Enemella evansiae]|uniref:fumarylacetoacetate hydrolase family protein n=1 Tax=Enemella evansiae TaxID=2016499 RepID=UPI000B95F11B|nr:fumarylacetoacetate hydrolase family protein [Enemella evansiae]OYO02035.1 hypothetical protein CGZ97_16700 [Enemella evansiae]
MRLCSYRTSDDELRHGRLGDDELIDDLGPGDLSALIALGSDGTPPARNTGDRLRLDEVTLVAPLLDPPKILCAASNYQAHIDEGGGQLVDPARTSPKIFTKPHTSLAGPGDVFEIPEISAGADWEAELTVVIGRGGRDIAVENALEHVFGYTVGNDISLRKLALGFERDTENAWVGFFDWLEGKWADGAAPIGPWIVTADEIIDPQALELTLTVNGELKQQSSTGAMIHSCAELIAFCSRLCTLSPGDLIMTGTPAGVGASTGTFLGDGDTMTASIAGIGDLTTPIRAKTDQADQTHQTDRADRAG